MPHTIRDVMTTGPAFVAPATSAQELVQRFEREGKSAFPVVTDDGTLAGIVTKLDLLRVLRTRVPGHEADFNWLAGHTAHDLMRPGVFTLEPDQSLATAIDLMVETRLRSLPVVERRRGGDPRLVGMVSQGDVLRALAAPHHDATAVHTE